MNTSRHVRRLLPALLLLLPTRAGAQTPAIKWPLVLDSERVPIREETAGPDAFLITTKLRYQTLILLPDDDPIVDVLAGDGGSEEKPGNWIISATKPATIQVKPTKPGADTNMNVITASGTVYSFLLREGRGDGKPVAMPDLRVTVRRAETFKPVEPPARKYYTAAEFDAVQAEVIALKAQLDAAERQKAEAAIPVPVTTEPGPMHFDYRYKDNKQFNVKAIWNDGRFTYIKHEASESPSVYELKDGKPAILDPKVPQPGLFVFHKVLDKGYLAIGDEKLPFARKD